MNRAWFALVLVTARALSGCSDVDENAVTQVRCPTFDDEATAFEDFRLVSTVLEKRCGMMDCHGSMARPLRIFGSSGLREPGVGNGLAADAGYYPGGRATTERELLDNHRSVCGLEPELMTAVVEKQAEPVDLLLVQKPLLREKHKGGRVFLPADEGNVCILSWLSGKVDEAACTTEAAKP